MSDEQQSSDIPTRSTRKSGPLTPEQRVLKQSRFLKAYRESGNVKYSCKSAGINRSTYYEWRDHDEAFKVQLPDANEDANDTLEYAAYDRAVRGVESYVVSMGRVVYEDILDLNEDGSQKLNKHGEPLTKRGKPIIERKYSDSLLVTLLKARMPEKYKDKQHVEHSGPNGAPMQHQSIPVDPRSLSAEQLALLKSLALDLQGDEP
jgi:hypothetical protein